MARERLRGYLLNADVLAALCGTIPVAVCPLCFRRHWAVNGHRVPGRETRRRLGVAEIRGGDDIHACRHCGAIM